MDKKYIIAFALVLAACGGEDAPNPTTRSANPPPPPPPDPTRLEALEDEIARRAQAVLDAQENSGTPDANLTGTWVEIWGELANGTGRYDNGNFNYVRERSGFLVHRVQQYGDILTVSLCDNSSSGSVVFSSSGGNTIFYFVGNSRDAEITNNQHIHFENRAAHYQLDDDEGNAIQITHWIKVDGSTADNIGELQQASAFTDIQCGSAVQEWTDFDDGYDEYRHQINLSSTGGVTYRNTGTHDSDGATYGDAEFSVDGNQYTVEFDAINSIFTLE